MLCSLFYGVCIYVQLTPKGKNGKYRVNCEPVVFSSRNRYGTPRPGLESLQEPCSGNSSGVGCIAGKWSVDNLLYFSRTVMGCAAGLLLQGLVAVGQSLSRAQLCDRTHRTPGFPVLHRLPQFAQTHVHRVGDAIQPSHPLPSPSLPASVVPSIRVFCSESALPIRWPQLPAWQVDSFHVSHQGKATEAYFLPNFCLWNWTFLFSFTL